jgi:glycosyltransferase involved in cell wall biosynthesis
MEREEYPLVSIVIPTYNTASYICETIESCLAQTYPRCEIIVVDDGSTDNTAELLTARYGDRICYLRQTRAGAAAARNHGIRAARGEFIKFCDADDLLTPTIVERCMAVLKQQPGTHIVHTRIQFIDVHSKTPLEPGPTPLSGDIFCDLLLGHGSGIQTSAVLARRQILLQVGLFDEDPRLMRCQDWDLWLRLARKYRFAAIDEPLVLYRLDLVRLRSLRYRKALGILTAVQKSRHYAERRACLDDDAYDQLEASRYHVLAVAYWEMGRRAEARSAFRHALRLDRWGGRKIRRLYILLTYFLPSTIASIIGPMAAKLRGR